MFIAHDDWMQRDGKKLTPKQAAELLWDQLIERAGISHD